MGVGMVGNVFGMIVQVFGLGIVVCGMVLVSVFFLIIICGNVLQGVLIGYIQFVVDSGEWNVNVLVGGVLGGGVVGLVNLVGGVV